ncbi:hypothetical protein D9M73_172440 [compost metagenome]
MASSSKWVWVSSASSKSRTLRWFFAGASITKVVSALLVKAFHSPPNSCMRSSRPPSPLASMPLNSRCSSRCGSSLSAQPKSSRPTPTTSLIATCPRSVPGLSNICKPLRRV